MEHTKYTQEEWQSIKKQVSYEVKGFPLNDEYIIEILNEEMGKNWMQEQFSNNKRSISFFIKYKRDLIQKSNIRKIITAITITNAQKIVEDIIANITNNSIPKIKECELLYTQKMANIIYGDSYLFYPHSFFELIKSNLERSNEYDDITDERWADYYYFSLCLYVSVLLQYSYDKKKAESYLSNFKLTEQKNNTQRTEEIIQELQKESEADIFVDMFKTNNVDITVSSLTPIIKNKKGKALFTIILALQRKGIMREINDNELSRLHRCLTKYFKNIGTYQALRKAREIYEKSKLDKENGKVANIYILESDIENIMNTIS